MEYCIILFTYFILYLSMLKYMQWNSDFLNPQAVETKVCLKNWQVQEIRGKITHSV